MDIWVMVDVVANHVGPVGNDFSQISPFNSPDHYHSNCDIQDWNNQWQVENCRLAGLPDLKQENPWVRQQLKDWIRNLVQTYNFDGIRIDTIPEVPKDFWAEFG
jgi:alpha-amylase